jgi:hypothetical protein
MTCGIYLLRFIGTDKVYIGQSKNIEARFIVHVGRLRRNEAASKLQEAFNLYGIPTFEILVECSETELDENEILGIEIFDSCNNGFNTFSKPLGGSCLIGDKNPSSKYSNEDIEYAFLMLVYTDLAHRIIAETTKVSKATIDAINSCKVHSWLKEKYPKEYYILANKPIRHSKNKTALEKGIIYPTIVCPNGIEYNVTNTSQFAKDHGLNNSHLVQVLLGKERQHKKWRLKDG